MRFAALSLLWATTAIAAPRRRDLTTTTTTATAYTTDTVHVTVTDTAYVIAELPPCAATGSVEIITTVPPAPDAQTTGDTGRPTEASIEASVASQIGSSPSGSASGGSISGSSSAVSISAGGDTSSAAETEDSSSSSGDPANLVPVTPSHIDPHSPSTLQPSNNGSLSYQQNGTDPSSEVPYLFAEANVTYQYPTVILPHSALISSVQCESDGLLITFEDGTAYNYVKTHWTTNHDQGFLLVAEWQACMGGSAADAGGHVYYLVSGLGYEDGKASVHIIGKVIAIENAVDQVDLTWGTYAPPGTTGSLPYGGGPAGSGGDSSPASTGDASGSDGSSSGDIYINGTSLSCLTPPSSYNGLPTAPCGYGFDDALDGELGYYDVEGSIKDGKAFAPGYDVDNTTFAERSYFSKRGSIAPCRWDPRTGKVRSGNFMCKDKKPAPPPPISTAERAAIKQLNDELAKYTSELKDKVRIGLIDGVKPGFEKTWGVNAGPTKLVDSKFGKGNSYLLFTGSKDKNSTSSTVTTKASASLNVYCVDCKVQGAVTIAGRLAFSFLQLKVDAAKVVIQGTALASAKLGIAVEANFKKEFNADIFEAPIPNAGFKIGKIVTVGAFTKLSATGVLDISAEGQLLVGATASVPNFQATLDAVGSSSGVSGFQPIFNKTFDASGEISVTAGLGLPMSLSIKVEIPLVKFSKELALINTPSLTASAILKASNDLSDTAQCNNGLNYTVNAKDALDFRLVDKVYPLTQFNKTLITGCYTLPYARNKTVRAAILSRKANSAPIPHLQTRAPSNTTESGLHNSTTASNSSMTLSTTTSLPTSSISDKATATSLSMSTPSTYSLEDPTEIQAFNDGNVYNDTSITDSTSEGLFNQSIAGISNENGAIVDDLAGTSYISVLDSTGAYCLATDDVGNFFLDDAANAAAFTYASQDDIIEGDGEDLAFFYYPNEMTELGVSRFRMKDTRHLPKTSQLLTLTPINYDNNLGYYAAVDSKNNAFYLAVCSITGLNSKIFLVKDIDSGLQTLADPNLQSVITGGVVTGCVPLALKSATAGF